MISRWLSLVAAQAILRIGARLLGWLALAGLAVAAAPVSAVAIGAFTVAWRRSCPARRLLIAAAWCGPMVAVWLAWIARAAPGWPSLASAAYHAMLAFWHLAAAGALARAAVTAAPPAIPLGLAAGALAWAYRTGSMSAGVGGLSPAARVSFDQRQWRHQERSARARIAAPGSIPLIMRGDLLVVGSVIRTVGHQAGRLAVIEYPRLASHQVVVGMPGTGKTTLLLRLWTAFMAAGLRRHAAGLGAAPLLVVLDCKGGSDARMVADRFRRVLRQAGVGSVAIWPDEASLSLWQLPPRQLTTTLVDLIEHGTGSAAYYADVMEALIGLVVEAPGGPPRSAGELLGRLEAGWLAAAYAGSGTAADHAVIRSASRHLGDVALRFRTLFGRLGPGLDGPGSFGDADAWYCILEGTDQISVAEGQARFPFWRRQGSSRVREVPVVDRGIIRRLDVGQVAYIYRGGVTYIQVKRLVAALPAVGLRPPWSGTGRPQVAATGSGAVDGGDEEGAGQPGRAPSLAGPGGLPDVSPVLDAAFGPEPRP